MPENHSLAHTPANEGADHPPSDIQRETYGSTGAFQDDVAADAESNQDAIESLGDRMIDSLKSVANDPKQMVRAVRALVRDYPLVSLATVALASLAVARVSRR